MGFYVKNAEKYLIKAKIILKIYWNDSPWPPMTSYDICRSPSACMVHIPSKTLLIWIGTSRGNSRPLVVILRIVKRLRFINLSNQPFEAEKVPFGRILSASARIIPVETHKPAALLSIIHANNSFSIVGCWQMSTLARRYLVWSWVTHGLLKK